MYFLVYPGARDVNQPHDMFATVRTPALASSFSRTYIYIYVRIRTLTCAHAAAAAAGDETGRKNKKLLRQQRGEEEIKEIACEREELGAEVSIVLVI